MKPGGSCRLLSNLLTDVAVSPDLPRHGLLAVQRYGSGEAWE